MEKQMYKDQNGKEWSAETLQKMIDEYTQKHPEPYIFKAGDVVETRRKDKLKRIIVKKNFGGELISVDEKGNVWLVSQPQFAQNYTKVGELKDILK
jgi:hypothetical protein